MRHGRPNEAAWIAKKVVNNDGILVAENNILPEPLVSLGFSSEEKTGLAKVETFFLITSAVGHDVLRAMKHMREINIVLPRECHDTRMTLESIEEPLPSKSGGGRPMNDRHT